MVRLLAAALLVAASAVAAQAAPAAPAVDASGLVTPAVLDALKEIKAASPQWTSVDTTIAVNPGFVMIGDTGLRISVNGSGSGPGAYFSGFAGDDSVAFTVSPFGGAWTLFGSGVDLTVSPFGTGYSVNGAVGKTQVSCTIDRFGGGLSVWGQNGADLTVTGWGRSLQLYGRIDESRFDRKALAVLAATLSLAGPALR